MLLRLGVVNLEIDAWRLECLQLQSQAQCGTGRKISTFQFKQIFTVSQWRSKVAMSTWPNNRSGLRMSPGNNHRVTVKPSQGPGMKVGL